MKMIAWDSLHLSGAGLTDIWRRGAEQGTEVSETPEI